MPCTTILVGKGATNDGSTLIARTDDGFFDVKKMAVNRRKTRIYKSVIGHLTVELPEDPLRYTSCPSVDKTHGIWAATGINEANVGMTATETITTNPRVLGADPLVEYQKASGGKKAVPGGIGEEDIVELVLPYIRTAREGVLRLGNLLEQYGTYESNGIAFNDADEVWWLETIGGHHWIARRVQDDECVIMPNQFGLDHFDMADAQGAKKDNLCSADLPAFIRDNGLDVGTSGKFNPRDCFGSHSDADHVYNTPRAWFMGRYLAPAQYKWEGEGADFGPESDDIPWSFRPDKKVTVEDLQYLLAAHYQGTPFDPYAPGSDPRRGKYRPIGINRPGVTSICQIRGDRPDALKGLEWICFGCTTFSAFLPVYTNVEKLPRYLTDVGLNATTENFYWASRLLGALADAHFASCANLIERYQMGITCKARELVNEYDRKFTESGDAALLEEANGKLCDMARAATGKAMDQVLKDASMHMRNNYVRGDH